MRQRWLRLAIGAGLIAVLASGAALAAPVWGKEHPLRQPNGEIVTVRIWGDEFYQVVESLDGYTLVRDPKTGIICYAELSPDGRELVSTGVRLGSAAKAALTVPAHLRITAESRWEKVCAARVSRPGPGAIAAGAKAPPPYQGVTEGICLIVDFPDEPGTIPASSVNDFCNLEGYNENGNDGSVRDYYYDVSTGVLTYTSFVAADYYTAVHEKSYYDHNIDDGGAMARALIYEALTALDSGGFDFSQYDVNDDGFVDAVNCLYAGYTLSGWSRGLWPHSGVLFPPFQADGVMVLQYQMTDMEDFLTIGTYCHENGHLLCLWPDLYDYGYESRGLGWHCLMAAGNHRNGGRNPVSPCAYLKEGAGWATPHVLTGTEQLGVTVTAGINDICRYPHPTNPYEYFLIENRQQTGRDAYLPDAGLAVWHADQQGSNNYEEMTPERHYRVTLVQADGDWDLEHNANSGDSTDYYKAPAYTECGPDTAPDTSWWDTSASYLRISNVSVSGPTMTFDFHGIGSASQDTDGDGLSDWDETRDLDPDTPGIQNPFNPNDDDSTGDDGSNEPDGVLDGDNDYDGDGTSNADELAWGGNPLDAASFVPAASFGGLLALGAVLAAVSRKTMRIRKP